MNPNKHLDHLFNPGSVALVGASSVFGKWGYNILSRLLSSKSNREVYAINDRESEILGLRTFGSVRDVPGPVDVAIVTVPSPITTSC